MFHNLSLESSLKTNGFQYIDVDMAFRKFVILYKHIAPIINFDRKRKNAKVAHVIRKKCLLLKLGRSEEDESINKLFKPLSDPLKEIEQFSKRLHQSVSRIKKDEPLLTSKNTPTTTPQIIRKVREKKKKCRFFERNIMVIMMTTIITDLKKSHKKQVFRNK